MGEKDSDLPARSRFGEGRAATLPRLDFRVANHMKTFNFEPTMVPHTQKTRVLKLCNPTAPPLTQDIATQSPKG